MKSLLCIIFLCIFSAASPNKVFFEYDVCLPPKVEEIKSEPDLLSLIKEVKTKKLEAALLQASGFRLKYKHLDTDIHPSLMLALSTLPYDKSISISSLRRRNGKSQSKHFTGKAVDISADTHGIMFIEWLLTTSEGKKWMELHKVRLYIEDKTHSKFLEAYKSHPTYKKYVFLNTCASGDHFHLDVQ